MVLMGMKKKLSPRLVRILMIEVVEDLHVLCGRNCGCGSAYPSDPCGVE